MWYGKRAWGARVSFSFGRFSNSMWSRGLGRLTAGIQKVYHREQITYICTRCRQLLTLTSLDCDLSLSWVWWVCRMRYAPICHSTSVLYATRTTLGPSGWWMMQNSWSAATCLVAGHGNMTQPHHPLHPTAHSKHYSRRDAPCWRECCLKSPVRTVLKSLYTLWTLLGSSRTNHHKA